MWFVIPSLTPSFMQDMLICQKNRTNNRLLIKGWSTDSLSPKALIGKKLSQVTEELLFRRAAMLLSLIIADELNNINRRSTYVPGLVNALLHG